MIKIWQNIFKKKLLNILVVAILMQCVNHFILLLWVQKTSVIFSLIFQDITSHIHYGVGRELNQWKGVNRKDPEILLQIYNLVINIESFVFNFC